jgi:hypothetical protein
MNIIDREKKNPLKKKLILTSVDFSRETVNIDFVWLFLRHKGKWLCYTQNQIFSRHSRNIRFLHSAVMEDGLSVSRRTATDITF